MPIQNEYDSPIARITWDKRGFFILKLKDGSAIFDCKEAMNQFKYFNENTKQHPYKIIIDTRGSLTTPTNCTLKFYEKLNKIKNKTAVIADTLPMQLMVAQMVKKIKAGNSMTFKTFEAASEWITNDK